VGYFQKVFSAGAAMPMRWMRSVGMIFTHRLSADEARMKSAKLISRRDYVIQPSVAVTQE
jgi:hypothetical protein